MANLADWRQQNRLTQADAAALLGYSQTYLSLLEKGERPLTATLRARLEAVCLKPESPALTDEQLRAQFGALGYTAFLHVSGQQVRVRPGTLLMTVLARRDADGRVVKALPWLVRAYEDQLPFRGLVRQAKLQNLQNRLGFLLATSGLTRANALEAIEELERSRLLKEDTLCWESMPAAVREWMRAHRSEAAAYWNVLTRLDVEGPSHGS